MKQIQDHIDIIRRILDRMQQSFEVSDNSIGLDFTEHLRNELRELEIIYNIEKARI